MEPRVRVLRSSATFNTMQSPASWRSCMSFDPLCALFSGNVRELDSEISTSGVQRELNQTFLPASPRSRAWHLAASSSSAVIAGVSRVEKCHAASRLVLDERQFQRPSLVKYLFELLLSNRLAENVRHMTTRCKFTRGIPCSSLPHPCRQLCPIADQLLP